MSFKKKKYMLDVCTFQLFISYYKMILIRSVTELFGA